MMGLVRKSCPDPMGSAKDHAHWSWHVKNLNISWSLWWDYDHRHFGCPIEVQIKTSKKRWLVRPFSKAQAYDWEAGTWTGTLTNNYDDIVWKHVVSFPSKG